MKAITSSSLNQVAKNKINENFLEGDNRLYTLEQSINLGLTPGAGFPGTGTVHKSGVLRVGNMFKTEIIIDLTGVSSAATDLDIIGTHVSNPAHIGWLTAAVAGGIFPMGRMTCLEVPVGGAIDIDLYQASQGTGFFSDGIVSGDYVESVLVTSAGNWTLGRSLPFTGQAGVGQHLYLVSGAAVGGQYTAGKFLIELWAYWL